jgi:hypothetical protein
LAFQTNETKFKVSFFSPYSCNSCEKVLKNAFFKSSEFEIFLKNTSWIKKAEKTNFFNGTEFFVDLPLSAKKQAILISNSELREEIKSVSFYEIEGWILDFDDYKVLLGKKELQARLKKIIKLTDKINKKDLKNKFLDLRYPKGFVIKNL